MLFKHYLLPLQRFALFIFNLNGLNFRKKENADHDKLSQQLLQIRPKKGN